MTLRAYAYASGHIVFRKRPPEGTLPLPALPRRKIEACARHVYDGRTLLVPGVPEAPDQSAALWAFEAWCAWLEGHKFEVTAHAL